MISKIMIVKDDQLFGKCGQIRLDCAKGLKTKEIVRAEILITENIETIRRKWNNVFGT